MPGFIAALAPLMAKIAATGKGAAVGKQGIKSALSGMGKNFGNNFMANLGSRMGGQGLGGGKGEAFTPEVQLPNVQAGAISGLPAMQQHPPLQGQQQSPFLKALLQAQNRY